MAKDVVKKEEVSAVSTAMPDFLKGVGPAGTESLSQEAITPPRLKLIQAISPEIQEFKGLSGGDFFNNVTYTNYGNTLKIIPCFMTEAYFLFQPRVPGITGGLLARAIDGVHWNPPNAEFEVVLDKKGRRTKWRTADTVLKSGLSGWGTSDPEDKNSPPAAVHAINCVVLLPEMMEEGPMVLSFVRSALKIGKKFAGNLKLSRAPSFGRVFELSSQSISGASGDYYEPRVKPLGFVSDENIFKEAESIYQSSRERGVDVDLGAEVAPDAGGGSAAAAADSAY